MSQHYTDEPPPNMCLFHRMTGKLVRWSTKVFNQTQKCCYKNMDKCCCMVLFGQFNWQIAMPVNL